MAKDHARFTEGTSVKSTRTTKQLGPGASFSRAPDGNTMKGMRGFVSTGQDKSDGGLRDSSGVGPHREGPVGERGHNRVGYMDGQKFRGSSDKSYRATSTGPAGSYESNHGTPHARKASEAEGPKRGEPRNKGAVSHQRNWHAGKMESLRGRAKTSWEK